MLTLSRWKDGFPEVGSAPAALTVRTVVCPAKTGALCTLFWTMCAGWCSCMLCTEGEVTATVMELPAPHQRQTFF